MWNVATGQIFPLTATRVVGRPAWSPDGSEIAFLDPQNRLLRTLNVQSGIMTPPSILYEGSDGAIRPPIVTRGGPAWSPDGMRIAFICWDGQGDELCVFDAGRGIRQQLTTLGGTGAGNSGPARSSVTSMAWSPDGVAIAVAVQAEQNGATAGVFRIDLAVRSGTRLTKTTVNAPIVWDAGNDDLVFSASVEGRSDVYRLPAAGGKPSAITLDLADGAREPAIDATGTLVVVSGSRVAVLRPGTDEVKFSEVAGLVCAAPALSADGKHLAYLALPHPIEQYP
jgi:TolB protein